MWYSNAVEGYELFKTYLSMPAMYLPEVGRQVGMSA